MSGPEQKCKTMNAIFSKTVLKYCLLLLKWSIQLRGTSRFLYFLQKKFITSTTGAEKGCSQ